MGAVLWLLAFTAAGREPAATFPIWPGPPPGVTPANGPEHRLEGRPRPFYQLTDISVPSLAVFLPPPAQRNGTAVLVCPGGGLQRLAYEHEGLEVADWLNSLGVTACVLRYRVPAPALSGAQDAQRALSLVRTRAAEWALDPDSIGIMGFSAGGEIAVWAMAHQTERLYDKLDGGDEASCRPDFAAIIYPGGLLQRGGGIKEPLASRLRPGLPPAFIAQAFDDGSENSLQLALALKRAKVPTEVHISQEGGHAFGVRATGVTADAWKESFRRWLTSLGFMDAPALRGYAAAAAASVATGQPPPRFTERLPGATLDDAYSAQHRLVRIIAATNRPVGYKAAAASPAAQAALGIDRPFAGVVFHAGRLDGSQPQMIGLPATGGVAVETEVGYLTSIDLSFEVLNDEQAHGAVASVVPIIELPRTFPSTGRATAQDAVAANVGSDRFIVGKLVDAAKFAPDAVPIVLRRDGEVINETNGGANAGQWRNLRLVLNEITRHGYTIPAGSVILGGALGKIQPGRPGAYEASFGELGTIRFELK